jgi:hypothetical protein
MIPSAWREGGQDCGTLEVGNLLNYEGKQYRLFNDKLS